MSLFKKERFSIRKIYGVVGSVLLGSILVAPSIVNASTYHYIEKSALTQVEQSKIQAGIPDENEATYALIYQQEALPATGSSTSVLTVLGLLSVGSLVLLVHKKKKVSSLFLVGTIGLFSISAIQAIDMTSPLKAPSNDGVVQIAGYRYIGYLTINDDLISEIQQETETTKNSRHEALEDQQVSDKNTISSVQSEINPSLIQPEISEINEGVKGEPGTSEFNEGVKGESFLQPENPEFNRGVRGEVLDQTEISAVESTSISKEIEPVDSPSTPETTKPVDTPKDPEVPANPVVSGKLELSTQPEAPEVPKEQVPSEHEKPVTSEGPSVPKTPIDPLVAEEAEVPEVPKAEQAVPSGESTQPTIPEAPKVPEQATVPKEPEKTVELVKPKEKAAPVLTLTKVTDDAMNRSATLDYHLENRDDVDVKGIVAEIKDGDKVVKRVDLSKEKLSDVVEGLDIYKDYKIVTTMIYDSGKGNEISKLDEKPLRLDLKKVELKNIASTNLVRVAEDGTETASDHLTEKPTDVHNFYLKVTSSDNKMTRLSVEKIEEVTEGGKSLYKVTAKAPDLVQHTDAAKMRAEYIYYMEKPRTKVGNVYYDFYELAKDMQANLAGDFKIGADLNAVNVLPAGKSYVTSKFKGTLSSVDGHQYTIHNLERPLFNEAEGAAVKNFNLANVNINMPWADKVAPLGNIFKKSTIKNVKVVGKVTGGNDVTGMVNKLDDSTMTNVAFIGKINITGSKGWWSGGLVSESWISNVEKAYVEADVRGNKASYGGIITKVNHGSDPNTVGQKGRLKNSVVKGTIDIQTPVEVGGLVHSNWSWGLVEHNITMAKVKNGEVLYGSKDIMEDDYFGANWVKDTNFTVTGVSEGSKSYGRSNKWRSISQEEADKKIRAYGITADKFEITELVVDKLNHITSKEDEYKSTQDYKSGRDLAYRNLEKLQPFYNKEWIVNQGNKLAEDSNLVKKTVLSVTGMKAGQFVTDLSDIDRIMIHYADGTKEELSVTAKAESKVSQVKEYDVTGQNIVYTPNMVVKTRSQLASAIKEKLASVELISDEVRALMDNRKNANENTSERRTEYIKNLYLEESFDEVKANLDKLVAQILENEDHQLNGGEAVERALLKKVEDNKAKIMMGLTYLNRYYDIKYGELSIKDIMMFKPDFYGKTPSVLDRLIQIGSREHFLKGDRTQDAYRDVIAGATGKGDLRSFLDYNMRLFTTDTDLNEWFIHSAKNVYVVEPETTTEAFKDKRHRVFDGLNNDIHGRMILPLLNLKKAHIFMISTYNTMAYSSFEKYGKNTKEARESLKPTINEVAKAQQRYLDFWSRLALPSVRDKLLKSQNMVPTPVWDNQWYDGIPDANRRGYGKNNVVVTPIRELFGPTDRWHQTDGRMGAMAKIYGDPYKDDQVYFMVTKMLEPFGISAFTHETTHVNDRMVYYGGHRHREGTDLEAFAQGMLQTPDKSTPNSEYGALGINMAYVRPNDGEQLYNYDPAKLDSRDKIDSYMKNYNESMMMLDYLEASAVIKQNLPDNSKWFKKMDKEWRTNADRNRLVGEPHQWDKLRDLTEEEKKLTIDSIDKLVDNNFVTRHGMPGNGRYRTEGFDSAYQTVNMMAGVFGGNTSRSTVGSISFKHNTFRMWGYYGYEKGFINYVSNKLKGEANKENGGLLGDDFIIKKVSNNRFQNLEEWKKYWYHEVHEKAQKGFVEIEIDGSKISTYAQLQELFNTAVEKDLKEGGFKHTEGLKWKVYKQLLQKSDGFLNPLFKS